VSRGWLGVLIQDVTRELAESFGMERPHGALIAKVLPDSPAAEAGLEVGDVVIRFDGEEVSFSSDLPPMVGNSIIGDFAPVDIIRRGKSRTINIKIAELPGENEIKLARTGSSATTSNALKIAVTNIDDQQRDELGIEGHGVIVAEISPGPARKAGIHKGDVILLINNIKVKDVAHFNEIVEGLPGEKSIPVLIQRRGGPIFLALKLKDDS
jgi:serine protease Do